MVDAPPLPAAALAKLPDWIARHGGRVTARSLRAFGCSRVRLAAVAALEELVRRGLGRWSVPAKAAGRGRPPGRQFILSQTATKIPRARKVALKAITEGVAELLSDRFEEGLGDWLDVLPDDVPADKVALTTGELGLLLEKLFPELYRDTGELQAPRRRRDADEPQPVGVPAVAGWEED